jgi:hypothetical protein
MQAITRAAIAGLALAIAPAAAFARGGFSGGHGAGAGAGTGGGRGGGVPGCEQAVTNVPSGTTDRACAGGPPGPSGWPGFVGGPDMRIGAQGQRNWPNYPDHRFGPGSAPITSQLTR